jgi:hypothetical protein
MTGEEKRKGGGCSFNYLYYSAIVYTEELRGCMQRNNTLKFDTRNKISKTLIISHPNSIAAACEARSQIPICKSM